MEQTTARGRSDRAEAACAEGRGRGADDWGWMARRLARMTVAEVGLRAWRGGRERVREWRWARGRLARSYDPLERRNLRLLRLDRPATDWNRGGFLLARELPAAGERWYGAWLEPAADGRALAAGWCPLLALGHVRIAEARDWHRDPLGGGEWPRAYGPRMNHRDTSNGGARLVWELHRLPQVALLGREFRRSGERRYALAVAEVFRSWLAANPPEVGIGWQSPLELALRMIAILHGADLVAGSGAIDRRLGGQLEVCAARHAQVIARNISRGSSANNHAIGEAAGLVIIGAALPALRGADRWVALGLRILRRELARQFADDGSGREQAPHYQAFATGFVLQAVRALAHAGRPVPAFLRGHLRASSRFLAALVLPGGRAIEPGDGDDGQVHGLSAGPAFALAETAQAAAWEARDWAALPRALRARLRPTTRWLYGDEPSCYGALRGVEPGKLSGSQLHGAAGWAVLRGGAPERTLFFDAGAHGLAPLDAHAHADSLAIAFWVGDEPIVVDPGTYRYHAGGEWRDHFRATRAHATITVDGCDQSSMAGAFLWRTRARARWGECHLGGELELISGEHDGYTRLSDPVRHQRRVLHLGQGRFLLHDHLRCAGRHRVQLRFPLAPGAHALCSSGSLADGGVTLSWETATGTRAVLFLSASFPARLRGAAQAPAAKPQAWVSPTFGVRVAGAVIELEGEISGDAFVTSYLCAEVASRRGSHAIQRAVRIPVTTRSGEPVAAATAMLVETAEMEETIVLGAEARPTEALCVAGYLFRGLAATCARGGSAGVQVRTLTAELAPADPRHLVPDASKDGFPSQLIAPSAESLVSTV